MNFLLELKKSLMFKHLGILHNDNYETKKQTNTNKINEIINYSPENIKENNND